MQKKKQPKKTELERRWEEDLEKEKEQPTSAPEAEGESGAQIEEPTEKPAGEQSGEPSGEAAAAQEAEAVALEVAALQTEVAGLNDKLLRLHAEFDNYRKRVARDGARLQKMAAEALISQLLPVVDNLDRALEHKDDTTGAFSEGVEMVLKQVGDVLEQNGVKPIVAVGEAFDPKVHEAVAHIASDEVEENKVTQEFLRGYTLGDLVLRPSKVAVSKGPDAEVAKSD